MTESDGVWKIISFNSRLSTVTGIKLNLDGMPFLNQEGSVTVKELVVPADEFEVLLFLSEKSPIRESERLEAKKLLNHLMAEKIMNDYFQGLLESTERGEPFKSDVIDRATTLFQMK